MKCQGWWLSKLQCVIRIGFTDSPLKDLEIKGDDEMGQLNASKALEKLKEGNRNFCKNKLGHEKQDAARRAELTGGIWAEIFWEGSDPRAQRY